jgi:threonine/homoserine/homoserine lactone efflux protein
LSSYALLVAQVGSLLRRPLAQRLMSAVLGTVLTALGVRLAFERR